MYKVFLTLRYLRRRYIAWFAVAAVVLCTAMVLIVMSVFGGFLDQVKRKSRGLLGDVVVSGSSVTGMPLYEEFIQEVQGWPEVIRATPVIYTVGILRLGDQPETRTPRVVGIRLQDAYEVTAFKRSLFYNTYYPDTTTLADQRQPIIGYHAHEPGVPFTDETGETREYPRFRLPPPLQQALERAIAAGVVDTETPPTFLAEVCRATGMPVFAGVHTIGSGEPGYEGEPLPGLIIGRDMVADRMSSGAYRRYSAFPRGLVATLTLVPIFDTGSVDTPTKVAFRYADDSRTGIYEVDSQTVYCDFDLLQKLLRMDQVPRAEGEGVVRARCSQIQVKLAPGADAAAVAARMQAAYEALGTRFDLLNSEQALLRRVRALTWEEQQAHVVGPVEREKQLVTILFAIISLVAAVLVLCILYMIVLDKTRDIGVVKSLGGSSSGVALIFVLYGAAIGIVGALVGVALGYTFVTNINTVHTFLAEQLGWKVWDRSVYTFDEIPSTVHAADALRVGVFAILSATCGSLAAALRAGRMHPVEAMRYE